MVVLNRIGMIHNNHFSPLSKNMHIETITSRKKKIVILSDRIRFDDSIQISKTIEACLHSKHNEIIIDLHKVEHMDSSVIGALIHSQILLKRYNKKIVLVAPRYCVKRIFRDFSLSNIFNIVESYDSKLQRSFN
jgi:anti-anti-sigma factor